VFAEAEATPTAAPYPPPLPRGSAPDPISKKAKEKSAEGFLSLSLLFATVKKTMFDGKS
jgi:hypothetical protein